MELMLMLDTNNVAQLLLQARKPGSALTALPEHSLPTDKTQAYAAQAALVSLLSADSGQPAGYKVGCTNATARQMLELDSPFSGRCFEGEISTSPSSVDASTLHMIGIEPEIAVRVGTDLAPSKDWQTADVIDHIEAVMPAIEIVESRFSTWVYRVAVRYLVSAKKVRDRDLGLTFDAFAADLEDGLVSEPPKAPDEVLLLNELRISCTMGFTKSMSASN